MRQSLLLLAMLAAPAEAASSLEFFGYNGPGVDRLTSPLVTVGGQSTPINLGSDFTIEFWMKADRSPNGGTVTGGASGDGWITGNIIVDRDVYGPGDFGDYGISLGRPDGDGSRRVLAFGLMQQSNGGRTLLGNIDVATGTWRHVAVTRRRSDGHMAIFVDGQLDAAITSGVTGDISYDPNRPTSYPNSDPFFVIGTEKHDADPANYPSYVGRLDELRVSDTIRYTTNFTAPTAAFAPDAATRLLLHFDEGAPNAPAGNYPILDATGLNTVTRYLGGAPLGPLFTSDTPFTTPLLPGDYDDNNTVDAADYVVWRKFEGTSTALPNDPNGLPIDDDQYNTWWTNFGESGGNGAGSAVPEPAGLVLLLGALLATFAMRRCDCCLLVQRLAASRLSPNFQPLR